MNGQGRLASMTEGAFKAQTIDLARALHWHVHHDRPALNERGEWRTASEGNSGFPDLVLARRGRVIFAELKTDTAYPSPKQRGWLDQLRPGFDPKAEMIRGAHQPEVYVWRPRDRRQIEEILR